jgi:hypothetical protein
MLLKRLFKVNGLSMASNCIEIIEESCQVKFINIKFRILFYDSVTASEKEAAVSLIGHHK